MRKGNKYYNNGEKEIVISSNDAIPEGYVPGRLTANSVHIHKDNVSKRVKKKELQSYLDDGWELGRAQFSEEAIDNIKESRKRFFEENPNWSNSTTWKKGRETWNKGLPMSESSKKKLSDKKRGTHLSSNALDQKVKKEKQTRIANYGSLELSYEKASHKRKLTLRRNLETNPQYFKTILDKRIHTCLNLYKTDYASQNEQVKAKRERTNFEKYGVNIATKNEEVKRKIIATKRKNKTFSKSKVEDKLWLLLIERFGEDDVVRQYSDYRYPFACDFYIKSKDLFIELNIYWTHGGHPFDKNNESDVKKLEYWRSKQETYINQKGKEVKNSFYTAEKVWVIDDVKKLMVAKENNLNYLTIYNEEDMYGIIGGI